MRLNTVVVTELDRNQFYTIRDINECWWRFMWESTPDIKGWYAWQKEASMERWVCLGTLSPERVVEIVTGQPEPLSPDDAIDFHLWMEKCYAKKTKDDPYSATKESSLKQEDS